ncbi:MAG: FAD:protein FMN transferase [Candidatus Aminicenantes bacterium]|nr:MAG: FAD:protein FMN transferase [Candidatus Aminicenantes bacterium]
MRDKHRKSVLRFSHFSMGTTFEIILAEKDEDYARQISQAVFTEIDRIKDIISRFDPTSEIGQINRLRAGHSLRIGVETYECLTTALMVQSQTRGAFDVNVGSLMKYREMEISESRPPRTDIQKQLVLSQKSHGYMVKYLPTKEMEGPTEMNLDLGAIGKGYALDCTLEILSDWGVERVLVHGGTSTALALGSPPEGPGQKKGWPVRIGGDWECPNTPKKFFLKDRALSGSGTEVKGDHIFDPRKNKPAEGHLSAWVSHPSAAVADALSTAFMVMNTEEVRVYCKERSDVWALVVVDHKTCEVFNPDIASK